MARCENSPSPPHRGGEGWGEVGFFGAQAAQKWFILKPSRSNYLSSDVTNQIQISKIRIANKKVIDIVGRKAWGVRLGVGTIFDVSFGNRLPETKHRPSRGQWNIWVTNAGWRLTQDSKMLAGAEDRTKNMETALSNLEGQEVEKIEIAAPFHDLQVSFSGNIKLSVFSIISVEDDNWIIFLPNDQCIVSGPGGVLDIRRSDIL